MSYLCEYPTSLAAPFGEPGQLRRFDPVDLTLSPEEARAVLIFFWPDRESDLRALSITDDERQFAQGLLVEAIDASYRMGIMEEMYRRFFLRVPRSFGSIATSAARVVLVALRRGWFRNAQRIRPDQARIYENVRVTIARNFRSELEIRLQTGQRGVNVRGLRGWIG